MHGRRRDWEFVKQISRAHGVHVGRALQALPLVYISSEQQELLRKYAVKELNYKSNADMLGTFKAQEVFDMFNEVAVEGVYMFGECRLVRLRRYYESTLLKHLWSVDCYMTRYSKEVETGQMSTLAYRGTVHLESPYLFEEVQLATYLDKELPMPLVWDTAYSKKPSPEFNKSEYRDAIQSYVATAMPWMILIFKWVLEMQKFPVTVRTAPNTGQKEVLKEKRTMRNKPWTSKYGATVEYLDRIPVLRETKPHQGGTHASPKGHTRKASRRTLRHPRYKNHPLYQVEGGIPVAPCWVGPTEGVINGKEYRLLHVGMTKEMLYDREKEESV